MGGLGSRPPSVSLCCPIRITVLSVSLQSAHGGSQQVQQVSEQGLAGNSCALHFLHLVVRSAWVMDSVLQCESDRLCP